MMRFYLQRYWQQRITNNDHSTLIFKGLQTVGSKFRVISHFNTDKAREITHMSLAEYKKTPAQGGQRSLSTVRWVMFNSYISTS